jgi:hypothetical protein
MFFKLGKIEGEGGLVSRRESQADHRGFRGALTISLPSEAIFFALQNTPENAFFVRKFKDVGRARLKYVITTRWYLSFSSSVPITATQDILILELGRLKRELG